MHLCARAAKPCAARRHDRCIRYPCRSMSVVTPIAIYCSAQRSDAKGPGCVKNVFTQPGSRTAAPITGYRDQCSPDSCRPGAFVWATEMLGRYCPAWLGSASDIRLNFIAKRACGHATPTNGLKRPNWHFCSRSSWIFGRTRSDLANTSLGQTKTPDQIEGHGKSSLAELEIALSSITAHPRCRLPKPEILARQLRYRQGHGLSG